MARGQGKVAGDKSPIVRDVPLACADETAAVEFMERLRWDGAPACPRCGDTDVAQMKGKDGKRSRRFLWRCRGCKRQFTVRIGTVLEDSRIPLRHWCYAFWAACSSKKGVSALQIKRMTGLSYKSALFLMHRIRWAMSDGDTPLPKMSGVIEADETWVGGKPRVRDKRHQGRYPDWKTPVMVLVERNGNARAWPIERVDSRTLQQAILENVQLSESALMTDENPSYPAVGMRFAGGHQTVKHSDDEYVRGEAHTNTAESFFSLLKRGIIGTFHSVSKHHLHRYVAEFQFRYNTRRMDDGARMQVAVRSAQGKRLTYA